MIREVHIKNINGLLKYTIAKFIVIEFVDSRKIKELIGSRWKYNLMSKYTAATISKEDNNRHKWEYCYKFKLDVLLRETIQLYIQYKVIILKWCNLVYKFHP
jgi:hypothetical protein